MKTRIEEAFFPWFQEQDPERFYSKELAARDGFIAGAEFMQGEVKALEEKLKVAVGALENYAQAKVYTGATARLALEKIKVTK